VEQAGEGLMVEWRIQIFNDELDDVQLLFSDSRLETLLDMPEHDFFVVGTREEALKVW